MPFQPFMWCIFELNQVKFEKLSKFLHKRQLGTQKPLFHVNLLPTIILRFIFPVLSHLCDKQFPSSQSHQISFRFPSKSTPSHLTKNFSVFILHSRQKQNFYDQLCFHKRILSLDAFALEFMTSSHYFPFFPPACHYFNIIMLIGFDLKIPQ